MKIAAVIPAAGKPVMTNKFKPMMCLGDRTLIERVILNMQAADIDDIVVITGYKADIVERVVKPLGVKICKNGRFAETSMFDSVKLGLVMLGNDYDRIFIIPGGIPLVKPQTISLLANSTATVVKPEYNGVSGHPIVVSGALVPMLLSARGTLQDALAGLDCSVETVSVNDEGVLLNANSPEEYRAICSIDARQKSAGKLHPDIEVIINKNGQVLSRQTVRFLRMIESTGSIQNGCACMNMSYTKGWKLLNAIEGDLGYPLITRSQGGTSGGGSALTPQGRMLLDLYDEYVAAVNAAGDKLFYTMFAQDEPTPHHTKPFRLPPQAQRP